MTLEQLSAAATQGEWTLEEEYTDLGRKILAITNSACENIVGEYPASEADAAFICALANAYRTGQLVAVADDAMVAVPRGVIEFLKGSAPLKGVWFGDKHPTERGAFWWRKHLPDPAMKDTRPALAAKGTGDE